MWHAIPVSFKNHTKQIKQIKLIIITLKDYFSASILCTLYLFELLKIERKKEKQTTNELANKTKRPIGSESENKNKTNTEEKTRN